MFLLSSQRNKLTHKWWWTLAEHVFPLSKEKDSSQVVEQ